MSSKEQAGLSHRVTNCIKITSFGTLGLFAAARFTETVPEAKLLAARGKLYLANTLAFSLGRMLNQAESLGGLRSLLGSGSVNMLRTPSGDLLRSAGSSFFAAGIILVAGIMLVERYMPKLREVSLNLRQGHSSGD